MDETDSIVTAVSDAHIIDNVVAVLGKGKDAQYLVHGDSMAPSIRGGRDWVTLRQLSSHPREGDIVLVFLPEKREYVLSRVMDVNQHRLVLMGDGLFITEVCTWDNVMGTVVGVGRNGGRWHRPGRGWLWRFLLPVRPCLLFLYRKIWN